MKTYLFLIWFILSKKCVFYSCSSKYAQFNFTCVFLYKNNKKIAIYTVYNARQKIQRFIVSKLNFFNILYFNIT